MHWPDPAQRTASPRSAITSPPASPKPTAKAGPARPKDSTISLAGAQDKLAQIDRRTRTPASVGLGMPALSRTQP